MEFAEIKEDPFTNNTNNFFLVIDIRSRAIPSPSSPGVSYAYSGQLFDPSGKLTGYFWLAAVQDYEVTGTLSDEAYAHTYHSKREWMLVPPKYQFTAFAEAIGFWLSPKEVVRFILGGLSLKGGD